MKASYLWGKPKYSELLEQELKFMTDYLVKLDESQAIANEAYRIITTRYEDGKGAATKLLDVLSTGFQDVFDGLGLGCTNQSHLLPVLLVRTGKFTENDIEKRWNFVWALIPHRYLMVKVEAKFIEMDPWAAKYGLPMGGHVHGWHTGNRHKKDLSNLNI